MICIMVYTICYIPIASWYISSKSGIYHEATFKMAPLAAAGTLILPVAGSAQALGPARAPWPSLSVPVTGSAQAAGGRPACKSDSHAPGSARAVGPGAAARPRRRPHLEGWVMLCNMLYNRGGVISHIPVI
jgi:hypothetical protein